MGLKYSMPIDCITDLRQKRIATVTDCSSDDAAVTTSVAAIIDCLQAYELIA